MSVFMNFVKDIFFSNMVDGVEDYKIWIYWIYICDVKGIINVYWSILKIMNNIVRRIYFGIFFFKFKIFVNIKFF